MIRTKKGKIPTKGVKQIIGENAATVSFYRNMALCAGVAYNIVTLMFYYEGITPGLVFMNALVMSIHILCCQLLLYLSQPKFSETSQLIDPGLDLNMEGGMGEHIKDIIILSSMTQVMAICSNYFWLLLLLLPIRILMLLWTHVLAPWFFEQPPAETEMDEKKKRKMERKMNRHYYQ